jgi:hypothetical protein
MPDLILHILVPLTALLLFYDRRYRKYIILLAPLAILPDIDHIITVGLQRALFHNVFILVPTLTLALYFYETRNASNKNDVSNLLYNITLIATFYLLSHLILDSFDGGVSLFYPFLLRKYPLVFDLAVQGGNIVPFFGVGVGAPITTEEPVTSLGVGILLTFSMGALFSYRYR